MELKCNINGKEYGANLVQGLTFSEEYNETLDSGIVIIDGVPKIEDLKPYDDVIVYEGTFNGWWPTATHSGFYKHLLVDNYTEELMNIDKKLYRYTIHLFSETKKLEAIQLPNISITQPLVIAKKKSVWDYINQFVDDYSTKHREESILYFNPLIENLPSKDLVIVNHQGIEDGVNIGSWVANGDIFYLKEFYEYVVGYVYEGLNVDTFTTTMSFDYSNIDNPELDFEMEIDVGASVYECPIEYIKFYENNTLIVEWSAQELYDNGGYASSYFDTQIPNEIEIEFRSPLKPTDYLYFGGATGNPVWEYRRNYKVDSRLQSIFKDTYSPDFTLNNPSLKDVLTQLMLTKDMIPYVKDNLICGLDITKRNGVFNFDTNCINNVVGSMSSNNYANNLRRSYSNALSQKQSARRVEYLGFRNSENALMTLDNMRLETAFPIYKINKVYMCYWKSGEVKKGGGISLSPQLFKTFMCKQDITDLVLLNSTRNLLSKDWDKFTNTEPTREQLAQYKLCTVGYDIGSKYITGWGTKYDYPSGWWGKSETKTYIENILTLVDRTRPYGIYDYGYVIRNSTLEYNQYLELLPLQQGLGEPFGTTTFAQKLKSIFFIVDYNAMYNGAVIHSKEEDVEEDITINDNSSSSLTLLEKDGLFQKEKINRFGNKAIQINATYRNINELQSLGSVYDNDVIIYHREYNITDKCIQCVYYGTKDYVLKNYYTSVYAKHRTYNLMSYGESVNRAENRKMYLMLSKNTSYFEKNNVFDFKAFRNDYIGLLLSAFKPSDKYITIGYKESPNRINAAYVINPTDTTKTRYMTDVNAFVSGYSLCFNMKMYDNVSMGVSIRDFSPQSVWQDVKKDFTGSVQNWNMIVDDVETGKCNSLGFYVSHIDFTNFMWDKIATDVAGLEFQNIFNLPKIDSTATLDNPIKETNVIGGDFIVHKDNKETIDMTLQLEPITNDKNILFSQWLMKLSDLLGTYDKNEVDYTTNDVIGHDYYDINGNLMYITNQFKPMILFELDQNVWNTLDKSKTNLKVSAGVVNFNKVYQTALIREYGMLQRYEVNFTSIERMTIDKIVFNVTQTISRTIGKLGEQETRIDYGNTLALHKVTSLGSSQCPSGKVWFTNIIMTSPDLPAKMYDDSKIYYSVGTTDVVPAERDYNFRTDRTMGYSQSISANAYVTTMNIASGGKVEKHSQNMFIVASDVELKKTLVYDEYSKTDYAFNNKIVKNIKVNDYIYYKRGDNNIPTLHIELKNIATLNKTKSIEYWYLDFESQSYKFVFGVNITNEDITKGYVDICVSMISSRDTRVLNILNKVVGNITNYKEITNKDYGIAQHYESILVK